MQKTKNTKFHYWKLEVVKMRSGNFAFAIEEPDERGYFSSGCKGRAGFTNYDVRQIIKGLQDLLGDKNENIM